MLNDPKVLHFTRKSSQLSKRTPFIYLQIKNHINFIPYQASFINSDPYSDTLNVLYPYATQIFCNGNIEKAFFRLFKHISSRSTEKIVRYIQQKNISIIHFHYGSDTTIYLNLIKNLNIPFVVSFYGYDATSFPKWYFGLGKFLLKKIVFNHAKYVLAMSPDMKTELIKLGCNEHKILVHYFGNEIEIFKNNNRVYEKPGYLKILIMASLVNQKGHLFLLKSLVRLKNFNLQYKLTIVGEGILETEIREFVNENDLTSYVDFKRNIPYGSPDMVNEYHSADIYVQPSVTTLKNEKEGIPGALIEAMASGLPVISTYHAGIPHVVRDNVTGLLVNEWDVESLSNCIVRLLSSSELRMKLGKSAQEFVITELDSRIKAIELEEIYSDAIQLYDANQDLKKK